MISARIEKRLAELSLALLALVELPATILWMLGPGLVWRDNPLTRALSRPTHWLYEHYVHGDRKGWPHG